MATSVNTYSFKLGIGSFTVLGYGPATVAGAATLWACGNRVYAPVLHNTAIRMLCFGVAQVNA